MADTIVEKSKGAEDDLDLKSDEFDDYDLPETGDSSHGSKKMAARRKIEMYWERKRLKDQLGDLDDIDFDF